MHPWRTAHGQGGRDAHLDPRLRHHGPDAAGRVRRHDLPAAPRTAALARRAASCSTRFSSAFRRPRRRRAILCRRPARGIGQPAIDRRRPSRRASWRSATNTAARAKTCMQLIAEGLQAATASSPFRSPTPPSARSNSRVSSGRGCQAWGIACTPPILASRSSSDWRRGRGRRRRRHPLHAGARARRRRAHQAAADQHRRRACGDPARHRLPAIGRQVDVHHRHASPVSPPRSPKSTRARSPMRIRIPVEYDGEPPKTLEETTQGAARSRSKTRTRSWPAGRLPLKNSRPAPT